MSNLELRIEEEASLNLTFGESSDMSFDAVDFVGVPFAPTVEVEDIEGGHRVSITSMGAEGKKTDEFDVMDGADGATGQQGPKGDSYEITAADYAEIAEVVEEDIQDVIDAAQDATSDATAAAAEARAASAATWLSGNALFGELAEGVVLTADDAYAAPPKFLSVYGVSTQVTTTGKNLVNMNALTDGYLDANGVVKGVLSQNRHTDYIGIEAETTYTLSFEQASTNGAYYSVWYDESKTFISSFNYTTRTKTVTAPANARYIRVSFSLSGHIKAQLELGSTATSYEPYSGGAASPRPDWPQPIESVDELAIHANNTRGATWWNQLYDYGLATTGTSNGITVASNGDGSFTCTGTASAQCTFTWRNNSYYIFKANHKYLLTGLCPANGSATTFVAIDAWSSTFITLNGTAFLTIGAIDKLVSPALRVYSGATINGVCTPQIFDLTAMFGAGNEPSTVEEFTAMFPEPYYPYDSGSWLDSGDWPVSIHLSNHYARSLPDGTRDTLTLSYIGPSTEHEGWGVFGAEIKSVIASATFDGTDMAHWIVEGADRPYFVYTWQNTGATETSYTVLSNNNSRCSAGKVVTIANANNNIGYFNTNQQMRFRPFVTDGQTVTVADLAAYFAEHPTTFMVPMQTTTIINLGTIELPILPNPLTAWADGGSAQPTMQLEYERALSIVIPRIEAAISDLATS